MAIRDRRVTALSWLTMLKHATRQSSSEPVTKDKLAVYAGLLADEFGPEAFTSDSLKMVADSCEFFPAQKVVRDFLVVYLGRHRRIAPPPMYPTIPDWLVEKMLENGTPGTMMTNYLASKGISPSWPGAITPERQEARKRDLANEWDDERAVIAKAKDVRGLDRTTKLQQTIQQRVLDTFLLTIKIHAPQHFDTAVAILRGGYTEAEPVSVFG